MYSLKNPEFKFWLITNILMNIPIVNIFYLIFVFVTYTDESVKNYAKAGLITKLIVFISYILLIVIFICLVSMFGNIF